MNKVILMGRLTRDPEVRYTPGENSFAIARYTLAVDRKIRKDGDATADFINCVVFGRSAEFAEKYFRKGLKITIEGRIQTRSYTNRDGQKFIRQRLLWKNRNLQKAKALDLAAVSIMFHNNHQMWDLMVS